MQVYVKNYLEHWGFVEGDFLPCQVCGAQSVDVHHIIFRSKFGKKRIIERDHWRNLIALCRTCHDKAHNNEFTVLYLQKKIGRK